MILSFIFICCIYVNFSLFSEHFKDYTHFLVFAMLGLGLVPVHLLIPTKHLGNHEISTVPMKQPLNNKDKWIMSITNYVIFVQYKKNMIKVCKSNQRWVMLKTMKECTCVNQTRWNKTCINGIFIHQNFIWIHFHKFTSAISIHLMPMRAKRNFHRIWIAMGKSRW